MANTIRIKRRSSGGTGAPSSLYNAELAFNEVDKVLYYGLGTGGAGGTATSVIAIAGEGAFLTLSGTGTATVTRAVTFSGNVDLGSTTVATTPTSSDNSTKVATTAFIKAQNYLTANQSITISGDATGSGTTAITLTLANSGVTLGTYTKVTVNAKGLVTSGTTLAASDIPTLTASKISDFDTQVRTSRLDQMAAPTSAVAYNSQRITGLADPVNAQDAATKNYVDSTAQGLDPKASVRVGTQSNITLSAPGSTIDGITMVSGDRVLVKAQSTPSQNGIYVYNGAAAAMTRASDANSTTTLTAGSFVFIEEGTDTNNGFVLQKPTGTYVLGTSSLTFVQFNGSGSTNAGAGLTKTGNTIDVIGTANRIDVFSDNIDIAATYVGQTSITTLGTIGTGTWNGSTIAVSYGGTGATTLTGILKGNGTSAFTAAVAGTDYLDPNSTLDGGTF